MEYPLKAAMALALVSLLSGCNLTDEEKERIDKAEDNLEKVALAPAITYPANGDLVSADSLVRVDVDDSIEYKSVSLLVNGREVEVDTEYPYEFAWQPYFWSQSEKVSLMVRAISADEALLRSEAVSVAIDKLAFKKAITASSTLTDTKIAYAPKDLVLEWGEVEGALAYEYQLNDQAIVELSESKVVFAELNVGEYTVSARANNGEETGVWNQVAHFEVLAPIAPEVIGSNVDPSGSQKVEVALDTTANYSSVRLVVNGNTVETRDTPPYSFTWAPYYWSGADSIVWHIEAETSDGIKLTSSTQEFDLDKSPYDAHIEVSPVDGMFEYTDVNTLDVSWNVVPAAASYEYSVNSTLFTATNPSVSIPALELGDYMVAVRAVDAAGRKGKWGPSITMTVSALDKPSITSPVASQRLTDTDKVVISWQAVDGAASYEYILDNSNAVRVSETSIEVPVGLGWHSISLRAVDSFDRVGKQTENVLFNIAAPESPALTIVQGETSEAFTISASWSSVSGSVQLQIAKDPQFSTLVYEEVHAAEQTEASYTAAAGRFYLRAKATDSVGHQSDWSNVSELVVGLFSTSINVASLGYDTSDSPVDIVLDEGDIVLLSSTDNNDTSGSDFHVSRWDIDGAKRWEKSFHALSSSPLSMAKSSNGFVLSGRGKGSWGDAVLFGVDSSGELLWHESILGSVDEAAKTRVNKHVDNVSQVGEGMYAYSLTTRHWTGDGSGSWQWQSFQSSIGIYDQPADIHTAFDIVQPVSGNYGVIEALLVQGEDIYAAGKYTAAGDSIDTSSGDYIPAVSQSGAYVVNATVADGIVAAFTGAGPYSSSVNTLAVTDFGVAVGYSYSSGSATIFDLAYDAETIIDNTLISALTTSSTKNGDTIMIAKARDSRVVGEPLVYVRYSGTTELQRVHIDSYLNGFSLKKAFYDPKYGTVIMGTEGARGRDTQTVIFNISDSGEYFLQ